MTAPHFLDDAEAEDAVELAAFTGFDLNKPTSDAQLDAIASDLCRHLARAQADLDRYAEAELAEIRHIKLFYSSRYEPLELRIKQLEAIGADIAQRATFPGKSKSRKVAFGSYGSRKVPEKIAVVDEAIAVDWLHTIEPDGNSIRVKRSVDLAAAKAIVLRHLAGTGELPPGFDHVGESEKYFIKPEP